MIARTIKEFVRRPVTSEDASIRDASGEIVGHDADAVARNGDAALADGAARMAVCLALWIREVRYPDGKKRPGKHPRWFMTSGEVDELLDAKGMTTVDFVGVYRRAEPFFGELDEIRSLQGDAKLVKLKALLGKLGLPASDSSLSRRRQNPSRQKYVRKRSVAPK